ncbi:hypothetical protein BH24BAC1_BH24BAC1_16800 [soil metagenome]
MSLFPRITIFLILFSSGLIYAQNETPNQEPMPTVERVALYENEHIPDFAFKDVNGEEVKLSSFEGKYILLDFWETVCAPCIWEIPEAQKSHDRIKKHYPQVVWLTVSSDRDVEKWKQVVKEKKMPGINLLSTREANKSVFHVPGWPSYILLTPERKIIGYALPTPTEGPLLEFIIHKGLQGVHAKEAYRLALQPTNNPKMLKHTEELKKFIKDVNWNQ